MTKKGFNQKNIYVLYLTRDGHEPADYSLSEDNKNEMDINFQCVAHSFIAKFLEDILTNKKEVLDRDGFEVLKSAIIQVIENQKYLSGETEEQDIMKEEVSKIIKGMVQDGKIDIKDRVNCNDYYNLFQSAANECLLITTLNFYEKILNLLKEKKSNEILVDENYREFINNTIYKNMSEYKPIFSIMIKKDLIICLQFHRR